MITKEQYEEAKRTIEQYILELNDKIKEAKEIIGLKDPKDECILDHLSARPKHALRARGHGETIHEFAKLDISIKDLRTYRHMGKKSIKEINDLLIIYGYNPLRKGY